MKDEPRNPNDRENKTPKTKGNQKDDRKFTSYDTSREETSTPQQVRERGESTGEQKRKSKVNTKNEKDSSS
ncbi:MAG: hypothetical protein ABI477_05090 [Chryseolinea sp.]